MIPYAVFSIKAVWKTAQLEISADELLFNGFVFAAGQNARKLLACRPERFDFLFLDRDNREYGALSVASFTLSRRSDDKFEFSTGDAAFLTGFRRLISEYYRYIMVKTGTEEQQLLEALTGEGFKGRFSSDVPSWRREMLAGAPLFSGTILPCELAAVLDRPSAFEAFLTLDKAGFVSSYFEDNGLKDHPLSGPDVTHIYIGSQFCPRLFPEEEQLYGILDTCHKRGYAPVVCFPPMPERESCEYLRRAERLPRGIECVINDIGTAVMLSNRGFHLRAGVFFDRRRRDPRLYKRVRPELDMKAVSSGLDSDEYIEYLMSIGIESFSYEACGLPLSPRPGSTLHLPLYSVNTALMCPLKAAVETGSRGKSGPDDYCPAYCEHSAFFYRNDLRLIGRFNSLFGFSPSEISDSTVLNGLIESGISRLAVTL